MSITRWKRLGQGMSVLVLSALAGCSETKTESDSPYLPDPNTFAPVSGVVTLEGKPLATAVVTFLPLIGLPGIAETDAEGKYVIECMGRPGIQPGEYKVAISYLVSAEGEPQGLGPRNAMVQAPGMLSAKEVIEVEVSDFGKTKLRASVPQKGATFDFAVNRRPDAPKTAAKNAESDASKSLDKAEAKKAEQGASKAPEKPAPKPEDGEPVKAETKTEAKKAG
ncbi:MAG: carboxypeptidase-like regulatory domain-containing protein [Isosphaeraceae bacterium]